MVAKKAKVCLKMQLAFGKKIIAPLATVAFVSGFGIVCFESGVYRFIVRFFHLGLVFFHGLRKQESPPPQVAAMGL